MGAGTGDGEDGGTALRTPGSAAAPGAAGRRTTAAGAGVAERRPTGGGVNPAAVTGREEPSSGATGVSPRPAADARGVADAADTADCRVTDGPALAAGAAKVRGAGAEAGARAGEGARAGAGCWTEAGARDDRCTGGAPPERRDPDALFTAGRTGAPAAEPDGEPGAGRTPGADTATGAGTGRGPPGSGTVEAGRRTGTEGAAVCRCTGSTVADRATSDPPAMGGEGRVAGVVLSAGFPPETPDGRTGAPGTGAP